MENKHELYALWMLCVSKQCSKQIYNAVKYFKSPEEVYFARPADFDPGVFTPEEISSFAPRDLSDARKVSEYCRKNGIKIIAYSDSEYPPSLRELAQTPPVLFVKGDASCLTELPCTAIIGTRECTDNGRKLAASIAYDLASAGLCVVSGMAKGIDTFAHKGALLAQKPTAAVLPCGVDICYPNLNRELYTRIAQSGALVSEYLPGTKCQPFFFQMRNRIISGLSESILVVETQIKGGSMITVRHALDQSRIIFAIPGAPGIPQSVGTNELIKDGALVCTSAQDIIDEYNIRCGTQFEIPKKRKIVPLIPLKNVSKPISEPKTAFVKAEITASDTEPIRSAEELGLTGSEAEIYNTIAKNQPCSVDTVCDVTAVSFPEAVALLSGMELLGYIEALPGGHYKVN